MQLHDVIPFWPDNNTYYVPWIRFRTEDGSMADGPMIRQGLGRREILAWTSWSAAEAAARALVEQTGGSWKIKESSRKDIGETCKQYRAWGDKVVAVILK